MTPFVITPPVNVVMQIGDVVVEFMGDPPPEVLLELVKSQAAFAKTAELAVQVELIGTLVDRLRELTVPDSLPAFEKLADAGVLSTVVVMQMFAHLIESYGESLGFQSGTSAPSPSGPPDTVATSAE